MTKATAGFSIVQYIRLFKDAFNELGRNDPLRMAGATAFFTTFALPPILIIIIQVLGLFFDPLKVRGELLERLTTIIGKESVYQIIQVLKAFSRLAQNWFITIGGFVFLLFVATTLFKVIQSSLNQLWKIKVVQKRSLWMGLRNRLYSILMILVAGLLLMIGLMAEGIKAVLGNYLHELVPAVANYLNSGVNYLLSVVIVMLWFAILFRVLPDGQPGWKIALAGGLITSILFNVGKIAIRWLLTYSNIKTVYGASGSIILLLLFVFYTSFILYYGAAFTKVWGLHQHQPIKPRHYAIRYKLAETKEEE